MSKMRMMGVGMAPRVWATFVAAAALGCTMQTGDGADASGEPDESSLGEQSSALDASYDRPAAAAVGVLLNGGTIREMWVFVCNSDNVLRRKRKASWSSSYGSWETVTTTPCSGVPTAGAGQATPKDDVEVFFRSTSGKLIEIYYKSNGTIVERDLSTQLGLGNINGNPVITNMSTFGHYSVAYRKNPSNWLMTLTYIPGTKPTSGWHVQTTAADNGVGKGHGQLTAFYTPSQTYLAAGYYDRWRVYTRSSYTEAYTQINAPLDNVPSVLTFAPPTETTMHLVNRDSNNRVIKSDIVAGQPWAFDRAGPDRYIGTPFMAGSWNYESAGSPGHPRGAAGCFSPSVYGYMCALYGLDDSQDEWLDSTPGMGSAGTRPVNAGGYMKNLVFWVDSVNHLYEANLVAPEPTPAVDMAILTLPP